MGLKKGGGGRSCQVDQSEQLKLRRSHILKHKTVFWRQCIVLLFILSKFCFS
jgi:hypothetical protein